MPVDQPAPPAGLGELSTEGQQTAAGASGQAQTSEPTTWYPDAHADYAKKFSDVNAALTAGASAERKITEQGQQLSAHQRFLDEKFLPTFGSMEKFDEWLQQVMDHAAKAGKGGQGQQTGEEGEPTPEQKAANAELAKSRTSLDGATKEVQAQRAESWEAASGEGTDRFFKDHPAAEAHGEAIEKIIASGVLQLHKPHMAMSHYALINNAWAIVQSQLGIREAAAGAAGEVEGGGGDAELGGDDIFDQPLDATRAALVKRAAALPPAG